jgi:nucleolin
MTTTTKEQETDETTPRDAAENDEEIEHDEDEPKGKRKRKRKRKAKQQETEASATDAGGEIDNTSADVLGKVDMTKTNQVDRTVFVEGIPYVCSEQDVRDFFSGHGLEDIEDLRLPVWQDSGRLRGYGHVVFACQESHKKAIQELSGKYLKNRYLSVKPAAAPKGPEDSSKEHHRPEQNLKPSKTIMLQNLSYEATEEDIQPVLEYFGKTVSGGIRVVRHSSTQRSKGFAYVEFESIESATAAYESKRPIAVQGRPCRVDYDHGRMKGSYRAASGHLWEKEFGGDSKSPVSVNVNANASQKGNDGNKRARSAERGRLNRASKSGTN